MLFNAFVLVLLGFIASGCWLILTNLNILTKDAIASAKIQRDFSQEIERVQEEIQSCREEIQSRDFKINRRLMRISSSIKKKKRFK